MMHLPIHLQTSRRHFIQGCALTAAGLTVSKTSLYFSVAEAAKEKVSKPVQVVIYQDKAHFDRSGLLAPYKPPVSLASSTRQYVEKVDALTLLSRHWFV